VLDQDDFFSVGRAKLSDGVPLWDACMGRLYGAPLQAYARAPIAAPIVAARNSLLGRLCRQMRPIKYINPKTSQDIRYQLLCNCSSPRSELPITIFFA